jgi:hypothetical protein
VTVVSSQRMLEVISRAATAHLGRPWRPTGFTDLGERASHPCGIAHGSPMSFFVKRATSGESTAEFR